MNKLTVSVSPHIVNNVSTPVIMRDVIIALVPALVASVLVFGFRALLITVICVAVCVFAEWAFEKLSLI